MRVTFAEPLPGFPDVVDYEFAGVAGAAGLNTLRAPGVRLFLLDAARYLPDYLPNVDVRDADRLFVVVTPASEDGGGMTVNLLAPVVINESLGAGSQVIVEGDLESVRTPLSLG